MILTGQNIDVYEITSIFSSFYSFDGCSRLLFQRPIIYILSVQRYVSGLNDMGSVHYQWMMGVCIFILLITAQSAAEPGMQGLEDTMLIPGVADEDLNLTAVQTDTAGLLLASFSTLQEKILSEGQYTKAAAGTGWQNLAMPVVITSPGMYRIINDYTATGEQIGVLIQSSDVYLDGNGHTFSGSPDHESYGVGISHDSPLSNITITNISTRDCTGGVAFERVSDIKISDTCHLRTTGGIAGIVAQNLEVSNNSIIGHKPDSQSESRFGIAVMQSSGIRLDGNRISNLSPDSEDSASTAISLFQTGGVHLTRNEIVGPVSVGIMSNSAFYLDENSFVISDNLISDVGLYGIYIDEGEGQVRNNTVSNGKVGVELNLDNTAIIDNSIHGNLQRGLVIQGKNLTLSGNTLTDNRCHLYIEGQNEDNFLHQIDRTNLLDGRPLIYIREQDGVTIGPSEDPAMVLAVRSRNLTIHDVNTKDTMAGILLINSSDISISKVRDTGSVNGIVATNVKRCSITDSSVYNNSLYGFVLRSCAQLFVDWCHASGSSGNAFVLLNTEDVLLNASYAHVFNPPFIEEDAHGAYIDSSRNVSILNSIFAQSPDSGMYITNSERILIKKSHLGENQEHGIVMMECMDSTIEESLILNNTRTGIDMDFVTGFSIRRNIIKNNMDAGMRFLDVSDGIITDNLLNNPENIQFVWGSSPLVWNTTLTPGDNVVHGPNLGGNFWASPDGQGFSETHPDRGDGICNASYSINHENVDHLPLAIPPEEMIVNFSANKTAGVPPLTIGFSDLSSSYPSSWNWNFGDGTGSSEQNPVHTYTGIGRYTVTLEAAGEDGLGIDRKAALIDVNRGWAVGPSGLLTVNSTPQNGSVYLDGVFIGYTPLEKAGIPAGTHEITISHTGYQSWSHLITIQQGQITLVPTVRLRKGE